MAEQGKLKLIVNCMNDAVIFAAPSGRVLLFNRAAAGMLAPRPGAADDVYVCHEPHVWDKLLAKLTDPGPSEVHPLLEIGGRQYEATYARVDGPHGGLYGAVMVARDVTERLQEQVTRMQEERMATVGKLAAALAHELNNPLGAIALFSQHALKGLEPTSRLAEHLGTVLRNADLCKKIVRDLLEYARQRPPQSKPFLLEDLLGDVRRTLAPYCAQAGIALETIVDPRLPRQAVGDPVQLRQLLVNLGLNAVEAMTAGGALTFRASGSDGVLRFAVEDTGPGVAAAERDRIFSAFYTTKSEGTGLGLAVARDIAEGHAGQLELDESHTAGARFVLSIPVRSLPSARVEAAA
jgi:two-component system sensor histidine kinase FlrB